MSMDRTRPANPIRAALNAAMATPRMQLAVARFVNDLVDEGESILRKSFAGETLRVYQRKGAGQDERQARNLRVRAMAAAPASMSPAAIAQAEGISLRHVQRLLKTAPK